MAKSKKTKPLSGPTPEDEIESATAEDIVPDGYTRCQAVGNNNVIWHNNVYTLENGSIYTVPTDLFDFLSKSKMVSSVGV
jgi:hypothetical protein